MSRHECPCRNMGPVTTILHQISSKLAPFGFLFVLIYKTKATKGISVELNEYGVNLASKDQSIQEIYA